jgi:hypothetical protein
MSSKGVNYYFYVNSTSAKIQATKFNNGSSSPDFKQTFGSNANFQTGNVQIDYKFSFTSLYGSFNWNTTTTPVVAGNTSINPLTGNMGGGNLQNMMNTQSVLGADFAVSYGFYDAGSGVGDLTNQDQAYAYLTPPMSNWMGQLASQYPEVKNQPFSRFALPGSHDTGTFDLNTINSLLANPSAVTNFLPLIGGFLAQAVQISASQALIAITNLAVTQKDNILTMLNLGCRYFDFRPGYAPSQISSFATGIYHEHTVLPGYPFQNFLTDVLNWLIQNSTEIVVIGANNQGFEQSNMTPSEQVLENILAQVQQATNSSIVIGTAKDLNTSYGSLLEANKRLIFLNQIGDWYPAKKYDSYSDSAYATTKPQSIIGALNQITSAEQVGSDYTILQLQGTATATGKTVIAAAAASQSHASSPLISTKALFDSNTYPWLLANVATKLSPDNLVVFLNDFVDNALAQTAMAITIQRMGL